MTVFSCYSQFLSPRIVKTANTKPANNEGCLYRDRVKEKKRERERERREEGMSKKLVWYELIMINNVMACCKIFRWNF